MWQSDRSPPSGPDSRHATRSSVPRRSAIIAATIGVFIGIFVFFATIPFGQLVAGVAFFGGLITTTYYLLHVPNPRAAIGIGLYGAAVLVVISPFLWFLPEITAIGGTSPHLTNGELGQSSILITSVLVVPVISGVALFLFGLGYVIHQSHHRGADQAHDSVTDRSSDDHTTHRLTIGGVGVLAGMLNGILIRIALDDLWYPSGVVDPFSDLRESLPVWGILDHPGLIPWTVAFIVFASTVLIVTRHDNSKTVIIAALYNVAVLLSVTPVIGLLISDPSGFVQDVPYSLVSVVVIGLGFYTSAAVLFLFGHLITRLPPQNVLPPRR